MSYQVLKDIDNSDRLVVFERYVNRSSLDDIHLKSNAFATFRSSIKDYVDHVVHNHFDETEQGFIQRK